MTRRFSTVNGEARAVLLSPAMYDELAREAELARDLAAIQRSRKEIKQVKTRELHSFFKELHGELLELKSRQSQGKQRRRASRFTYPRLYKIKSASRVSLSPRDSVENAIDWETRLLSFLDRLSDFHGHAIDQNASSRLGGQDSVPLSSRKRT